MQHLKKFNENWNQQPSYDDTSEDVLNLIGGKEYKGPNYDLIVSKIDSLDELFDICDELNYMPVWVFLYYYKDEKEKAERYYNAYLKEYGDYYIWFHRTHGDNGWNVYLSNTDEIMFDVRGRDIDYKMKTFIEDNPEITF